MKPTAEQIKALRLVGMPKAKIAKLLNVTVRSVELVTDGLISQREVDNLPKPETVYQQITRLYRAGMTMEKISEVTGVPRGTVGVFLSASNVLKGKSHASQEIPRDDDFS